MATGAVAVAAVVAAIILVPSGDDRAVNAICSNEWNSADPESLTDVLNEYDYSSLPDEVIDMARDQCGEKFDEYDAYAADINRRYTETFDDPPSSASDPYSPDNELDFASSIHSCDELVAWYEANPGDSNLDIARQYFVECGDVPPPVLSGEITDAEEFFG